MQELNEKELETVVGGNGHSTFGLTNAGAGGAAGQFGHGSSSVVSSTGSTIEPGLITSSASNNSSANGTHGSFAVGGASSFAAGATR